MDRHRLPEERRSITHKFKIGTEKGYLIVGLYGDGQPGELFIHISKEGSTISGALDSFAVMVSMGLQYGIPMEVMVSKFKAVHFEPFGVTQNKDIPFAHSIIDYVFKWLEIRFMNKEVY